MGLVNKRGARCLQGAKGTKMGEIRRKLPHRSSNASDSSKECCSKDKAAPKDHLDNSLLNLLRQVGAALKKVVNKTKRRKKTTTR